MFTLWNIKSNSLLFFYLLDSKFIWFLILFIWKFAILMNRILLSIWYSGFSFLRWKRARNSSKSTGNIIIRSMMIKIASQWLINWFACMNFNTFICFIHFIFKYIHHSRRIYLRIRHIHTVCSTFISFRSPYFIT